MTREKAIEMLQNDMKLNHCTWSNEETEAVKMAIEALEQPEQKKGEWLMKWNTFFHRELPACSECGSGAAFKTKFCPCCGAEMENAYKGVSI